MAPSALEYFIQPENVLKISKSVEGRFVPVYRDHAKGDFWQTSKFAEMRKIAEVGRIREWPASPQPWLSDVTDAKYTLSDMVQKFIDAILLSFQDRFIGKSGTWVGFANYTALFADATTPWVKAAVTTLAVTGGAIGAKFLLGMAMACVLNQDIPGKNLFRGVMFLP